ncbi:MAG: methylenetetrahydrofolate--tRNA-(uracil(54)-C(5))-methyltransferase (FADH(2)-oxidizing) TrmFO [Bacillota bacterium]
MDRVTIIGGGLAGAEAAWQAAERGVPVDLFEMRPLKSTPAHHTGLLAELVCSNSLGADGRENASGLLKHELRSLESMVMRAADASRVPAGGALAVDREVFGRAVTAAIEGHPRINLVREEVTALPETGPSIVATGPLTSGALAQAIAGFTGSEAIFFFDAAAPIVTLDSVDLGRVYRASRYGKGGEDYLNCPLTIEEYRALREALVTAEQHPREEFEKAAFFEGCLPVEELARRGEETLRYGPLKPVGLPDPQTGRLPYAVVQLRQDNREGTLYNLVGFQTSLRFTEQRRVFRLIPGLEKAEFARHGVMHRNTYLRSPGLLDPTMITRPRADLLFGGQITGVEGYLESTATGLVAGINAARLVTGQAPLTFPPATMIGALCRYVSEADPNHFQPMNANFGILPPAPGIQKKLKKQFLILRAVKTLEEFMNIAN